MATRKRDNAGRQRRVDDALEVVCRIAPYNGEAPSIICEDDACIKAIPPAGLTQRNGQPLPVRAFKFAHVFDEADNQRRIFERSACDLIENLITGKNGLLFTYGVTGGGKTYTMAGNSQNAGILPRTLDVIFNSITNKADKCVFVPNGYNGFTVSSEESAAVARREAELHLSEHSTEVAERRTDSKQISGFSDDYVGAVFISYVEIYNNYIYDLLDDSTVTPISRDTRVDTRNNSYVDGAREVEVENADEALEVFIRGQERRRVSDTLLNKKSSRSHSVFTVRLVQAPFASESSYHPTSDPNKMVISQLSLVDLAGSERAKRTCNEGAKLAEAGAINNSLMTLRMCFEKLRANQRRRAPMQPVPYRDSKLTTLFRMYFEGSGKIRMILCVNPRPDDYSENLNVLEFGEESQAIRVEMAADVLVAHDGPRPPVPKRFFTRWNMEVDRIDTSSQASDVVSSLPPPELNCDDANVSSVFRRWAVERNEWASHCNKTLRESVLTTEPHVRNVCCTLDYRWHELEEMRRQKLEDEAALARVLAEHKQTKRENISLRTRLAAYEVEDEQAVNAEVQMRKSRREDRERMKLNARTMQKLTQICESSAASAPSVAQLRARFLATPNSTQLQNTQTTSSTESRRYDKENRQDPILAGGPGFYNPRYHRRSKSAPRVLDHQPVHRVPTGGVLRTRLPSNSLQTTVPVVSQLKKSTDYVLTHQNVDDQGNISTSIVKGQVIPTAGGGSAVQFRDVEKVTHEDPGRTTRT